METGTFPNGKLQEYIAGHFVPVKFISGADAEQFSRFAVTAVPAIIVLDSEGNEMYRKVGFVEADELIDLLEQAMKINAHRSEK